MTLSNEYGRLGEKRVFRLSAKSETYDGYLVFDVTDIMDFALHHTRREFQKLVQITVSHKKNHKKEGNDRSEKKKKHQVDHGVKQTGEVRRGQQHHQQEKVAGLTKDDGILVVFTENRSFFKSFRDQVHHGSKKQQEMRQENVDGSTGKRHRRSTAGKNARCGKKSMMVDFKVMGWDKWIVYPHTYEAFVCNGKCPSPVTWHDDPTNHSVLQSLLRLSNRNIPKPCCVPTKLGSISMLYYENEELVVRSHKDMTVDACGCR